MTARTVTKGTDLEMWNYSYSRVPMNPIGFIPIIGTAAMVDPGDAEHKSLVINFTSDGVVHDYSVFANTLVSPAENYS